jgi:predicted AAA+ superfamily ATPase
MKALAGELKNKFVRGIVLYAGSEVIPFDKNIAAVPLQALWT